MPVAHPRLFLAPENEPAWRVRVTGDPRLRKLSERVVDEAELLLEIPPVERVFVGRRLLGTARQVLNRIGYLGVAYRLTGEAHFAQRGIRELRAVADFVDWNPDHFLDTAEITTAFALGYDWFYHKMTDDERAAVREAIIEKGLKPSFKEPVPWWWVDRENNWNQVCHGGLAMGALMVFPDAPELATRTLHRALENLPLVMALYAPDGAYPEGPTYWEYGTSYNVLLIDALETALGTDFGLADFPGFLDTGEYYLHAQGPTGLLFNYMDNGIRQDAAAAMYWFARKRDQPALLYNELPKLAEEYDVDADPGSHSGRFLPLILIWAPPLGGINAPAETAYFGRGPTPVALLRTEWAPSATFVGIKGGSPAESHGHMDVGQFVLEMNGVRWVSDLGKQSYNPMEQAGLDIWNFGQHSDRWKVFRHRIDSHSTLMIDGQQQKVDGHAELVHGKAEPLFATLDMTPVYDWQLERAIRHIEILDGDRVRLRDSVKAVNDPARVRWAIVTRADVELTGDRTALLRRDGEMLRIEIQGPETASFIVEDISEPLEPWDEPNPNTSRLSFTHELEPLAEAELIVTFSAGDEG
ncbi:MAG: heparinase II/III family protein [Opitutales bacterium]